MRDFLETAVSFPPVVFTFGMILVVLYWLIVMLGLFDIDAFDSDVDADGDSFLSSLGFGSVPATVILSLWTITGWVVTMLGTIWLRSTSGATVWIVVGGIALLVAGLGLGMLIARLLAAPLSKVFEDAPVTQRSDLVGRQCVIRTGSVTTEYGQADVKDDSGAEHTVNIRRSHHEPEPVGDDDYGRGKTVVIFDYDDDTDTYLVIPTDID
ncbi:hypothetical protein [Salininema proteolyticum]|uniref:DUF1449 family protein n=1 Tax=Salininema proteolyticum TaxID=1607685 RepID=A0ABV8TT88_9ACTN